MDPSDKTHPLLFVDIFAISITVLLCLIIKRSRHVPYPPGPKGSFLFGNIKDVPVQKQWIAYQQMSQELGELFKRVPNT